MDAAATMLQNKLTLMIQQASWNSPWAEIKTACDTRKTRSCGCEVDVTTDLFKAIESKVNEALGLMTENTKVLQYRLQKVGEFNMEKLTDLIFGDPMFMLKINRATNKNLIAKMVDKIDRKYFMRTPS